MTLQLKCHSFLGSAVEKHWRVRDLGKGIASYMDSEEKPHEISNAQWLSKLAFLVDTREKLSYINALYKGKEKSFHYLFGEIKALKAKLKLWQKQLRQNVVLNMLVKLKLAI